MAFLLQPRLEENVARVRTRIEEAATRADRSPEDVRLVAVTKYSNLETSLAVHRAGVADLGESRVQAFEAKAIAFAEQGEQPTWHLVGTLQRNKVAKALAHADWLHSLDRASLWVAIENHAEELGRHPRLLLQINVSGESSKQGFEPEEALRFLERLDAREDGMPFEPAGLMTMAPLHATPAETRRVFAGLAELSESWRGKGLPLGEELSMGMSQDFELAIEEGATQVRVGTALFEGLENGGVS